MATFFDYAHYRPLLKEQALRWKKERPGWTLGRIAEKAQLQAPYLTNVLKDKAHLNADQLHSLADVFAWDEGEREYAHLLLDWERSGNPRRRELLKSRIEKIRKEKLQARAHSKNQVIETTPEEFTRFYLNPFYTLINNFIAVPRFAKQPKRIARALGMDPAQVTRYVKELVDMGFLAAGAQGYEKVRKNFLLPRESPLFNPHVQLMQQLSAQQMQRLPDDKKYNFSATFSADPATREKLQREFLKFAKALEVIVKESPSEELYGLRFDLFQWSHEGE
jgi:uncharacterized protein (TIGR02147 family)